jgi:hypothetical protein
VRKVEPTAPAATRAAACARILTALAVDPAISSAGSSLAGVEAKSISA